jgi:hypothetical protein
MTYVISSNSVTSEDLAKGSIGCRVRRVTAGPGRCRPPTKADGF